LPSTPDLPPSPLPSLRLKPRRAQPFFGGHPWVFAGALLDAEPELEPGTEVRLVTAEGTFVAVGLFNPHSQIRVRLYRWTDGLLDDEFWGGLVDRAVSLRRDLLGLIGPRTACRVVFSEADRLSGLIVDRYDDWLLVQFGSLAMYRHRERLLSILCERLKPRGVWLRTEKGIREAEGLEVEDGLLTGETPPRPIVVEEHGLEYEVDVVEGQKTGFFCDQRDNRMAAARYVERLPGTKRALDVCSYSGGFALHALRYGNAERVTCVDVSAGALDLARRNAERNGLADRIDFEKSDAFKSLERRRDAEERWDAVILDPPKLARHGKGVVEALRGYHGLNTLAAGVVAPGGLLVTCSCTGHVSPGQFRDMLQEVSQSSGREIQILETRGAAADHPVHALVPEGEYLKCVVCRVM
jgi:23S rRNA (cytosine1962-C5)-methyltransferase